ncbi:MAG: hypothetical protein IID15_06970 [Candidatus Marinimicrobia bacterium]|nr:hypothetical protein [Candidatus Neomarinimicrobiota bacterium]
MNIRFTVACLTAALAISPISSAITDLGPHCLGHAAVAQITSAEQSTALHGGHHSDCSWAKNGRNDLATQSTVKVISSLPRQGESSAHTDASYVSFLLADPTGRAPPQG